MRIDTIRRLAVSALVLMGSLAEAEEHPAGAIDFWVRPTLSGTSFDWTDKASYQKSSTNTSGYDYAPQAGDRIVLGENVKAAITTGTAAATLVKSMKQIILYDGAEFEITAESDVEWESSIIETTSSTIHTAKVVKRGAGNLKLMSYNTTQTYTASSEWKDYDVSWDVQAGKLTMVNCLEKSRNRWIEALHIAEGASVDPGTGTATVSDASKGNQYGGKLVLFGALSGTGTIEKEADDRGTVLEFRIRSAWNWFARFDGRITGKISLKLYGCELDLTRTDNDFSNGTTEMADLDGRHSTLGFTYENQSVGKDDFSMTQAGTLKCLSDGTYSYGYKGCYFIGCGLTYDGGAFGNWTTRDTIGLQSTYKKNTFITFTGSNQTECVYTGRFNSKTDDNGNRVSARLIKRGTGIWRMADPTESGTRNNGGVIEVDEGTLRFNSIAETNVVCALGRANALFESYEGAYDESKKVDYAFELGSTMATDYPATLEYVGANNATITTRKFALKGEGVLKIASGAGKLDLTGFGLLPGETTATLHLDSDSSSKVCVAREIDAGSGTINLVKDGVGAWSLVGKLAGIGSISVKEGALNYRNNVNYEYYRLVIKEAAVKSSDNYVQLSELGLFDKDGNRQNLYFTYQTGYDVDTLARGSFMMVNYAGTAACSYDRAPYAMFDDNITTNLTNKSGGSCANSVQIGSGNGSSYSIDNSNTWSCVVMRLDPLKCNPVVAFDMVANCNNTSTFQFGLSAWSLEGSVDGHNWIEVCNSTEADFDAERTINKWYKKNADYVNGETAKGVKTDSWSIDTYVAPTVTSTGLALKVDSGATLSLGAPITINRLTVSGDGYEGSTEGVTLAATGVLALEDVSNPREEILVSGINVNDNPEFANIVNWSVTINGRATASKPEVDADGNVKVTPCGLIFVLQ